MKRIFPLISILMGITLFITSIYLNIAQKAENKDMLVLFILAFIFSFLGTSLIWQSKSFEKKKKIRKYMLILLFLLIVLSIISFYTKIYFYWFYIITVLYFSFGITPLNASIRIIKWNDYVESKLALKLLSYADYLGIMFLTIGYTWKTMHWPLANQIIIAGLILLIFAAISWNRIFRKQIDLRIVVEKELKIKNKEIMDSINYAKRIQSSFLASEELLNQNLENYFIYFNPKEAVSGDFYWAKELDDGNFAISCADSTGHGVPGAIMSILNISSIEKAIENKAAKPSDIFNHARLSIIEQLKKDGSVEGGQDGMDATLMIFNPSKTKLLYVAAKNPIWVIRNDELINLGSEKMPVGKHKLDQVPFKGGEFDIQKGDKIYTMTDGFQDQFGGEKGKKFKVKPIKELLLNNNNLSMPEMHQLISNAFKDWKGDLEQVDDVCIIGISI